MSSIRHIRIFEDLGCLVAGVIALCMAAWIFWPLVTGDYKLLDRSGLSHVHCYSPSASLGQSQTAFCGWFAPGEIVPPSSERPFWEFGDYKVNGTCVVDAPLRERAEK